MMDDLLVAHQDPKTPRSPPGEFVALCKPDQPPGLVASSLTGWASLGFGPENSDQKVLLNSREQSYWQWVTSEKSSEDKRSARLGSRSGLESACPSTSCILSFVESGCFVSEAVVSSGHPSHPTRQSHFSPVLVNVIRKDAPASVVSFPFTHAHHTCSDKPPEISRLPDKERLPDSTASAGFHTLALIFGRLCPYKPPLLNLDTFYIVISITLATTETVCLDRPKIVVQH
jgi:hypothetical protein